MSKSAHQPKKDKARTSPRPPSRSDTVPPSLIQLKNTIKTSPGAVKNATDARNYLENKNYLLSQQHSSTTSLATILLSLVVPSGHRLTTERIPESTANVIKAVALLLEEATAAVYADRIMEKIDQHTTSSTRTPHNEEMLKLLQNNSDLLNAISTKHLETIEKTSALVEKFEKLQENVNTQTNTLGLPPTSFRDALIGNTRRAPPPTPNTPLEARLRNRLNIKACQVMVEIQSEHEDPLKAAYPDKENPIDKLKQATNTWLATESDDTTGPPDNSTIRTIKQYHSKRFLIETNKCETAEWIRDHPESLHSPFKNQVKLLNRLYPVVAHFMPTHFQTDPAGIRTLETDAKLDPQTISRATWIKDPKRRNLDQKHANIKIFCETPEAANALIMSSPLHLGTQLRIHKDIKAPGTCLNCQQYGHYATNCKETSPTCGKCANDHLTSECKSTTLKCTPCGSLDHQSNDPNCIERQNCESALLTKDVEALSPYYSTVERWTWSLSQEDNPPFEDPPALQKRFPRPPPQNCHAKQPQRPQTRQNTLFGSGFQRRPNQTQTGANSTPINNPRQRGTTQTTQTVTPATNEQTPNHPTQGSDQPAQSTSQHTACPPSQPQSAPSNIQPPAQHNSNQNAPNLSSQTRNQ